MAIGFSFGGERSQKRGRSAEFLQSTKDVDVTEQESIDTLNKEIATALESLVTGGKGETLRGTETSRSAIDQLIGTLSAPTATGEYSKEAAISDTEGAVQALMETIIGEGMGGVRDITNIAGAYDSTVQQQMRDALVTRAAGEGARLQQETIGQYAGISAQQESTRLASLLGVLQQAGESQVATSFEEEKLGTKKAETEAVSEVERKAEKEAKEKLGQTKRGSVSEKGLTTKFSLGSTAE